MQQSRTLTTAARQVSFSLFRGHTKLVEGNFTIIQDDSPIGYRQAVAVKAGLSMGSEFGNEKLESVMLGDSHELVFRSHALA